MGALADRWANAMSGGLAQQKYRDKINAYAGNPMEAAAAAVDSGYWLQRVQASAAKMAKKLRGVSVQTWKANATGPGATNMGTGALKGKAKMAAAESNIIAAGQAAKAAAHAAGTDPMARIRAALSAVKQTWGYGGM